MNRIISDLPTIDVITLQGVCENSLNIVREISDLATKEIQRRGHDSKLDAVTHRGEVKKNKKAWYSDSSDDGDGGGGARAYQRRLKTRTN